MNKPFIAIAIAAAAFTAGAEAVYTYDADTKTYIVTVPENEQASITAEAAEKLNANLYDEGQAITNFVKQGDGKLTVDLPLQDYEGNVIVADGIYAGKANTKTDYSAGKFSTGWVKVLDGATFRTESTVQDHYINRTFYFEGTGHNGTGALDAAGVGMSFGNTFGNPMVLTGDALVRVSCGSYVGVPGNGGAIDMGGHTLTYWPTSESYPAAYVNASSSTVYPANIGNIISKGQGIDMSGYWTWARGTTLDAADFIIADNSCIWCNGYSYGPTLRLVMKKNAKICLMDGTGETANAWNGSVLLDDPEKRSTIYNKATTGLKNFRITRLIHGNGFYVGHNCRLWLSNQNDDPNVTRADDKTSSFTNGIVLAEHSMLQLDWGSTIGARNGKVIMTNATFMVRNGLTYQLPPFEVNGVATFLGRMDNLSCTGVRETRMYFPDLVCAGGSVISGQCYQAYLRLTGLPEIRKYDVGCTLTNVWIGSSWTVPLADVKGGSSLKLPEDVDLVFSPNVTISVTGKAGGSAPRSFKIAETSGTGQILVAGANSYLAPKDAVYTPIGSSNKAPTATIVDDNRWSYRVGDDGKALYLDYTPKGIMLLVR